MARRILKEELVTVTNSVVKLSSLTSLVNGVDRVTLHALRANSADIEVLMKATAPTSGTMDTLAPDGAKMYGGEKAELDLIYVYAASSQKLCVTQEAPER